MVDKLKNAMHVQSLGDAIWRTAMLIGVVAVLILGYFTFTRLGDTKKDQNNNTEAVATLVATLNGFQQLADRGGCVSEVYGRFYLNVAITLDDGQTPQSMKDSKHELKGLVNGTVCPVPTIDGNGAGTTSSTVPNGG